MWPVPFFCLQLQTRWKWQCATGSPLARDPGFEKLFTNSKNMIVREVLSPKASDRRHATLSASACNCRLCSEQQPINSTASHDEPVSRKMCLKQTNTG